MPRKAKTRTLRCPTCKKLVMRGEPEFPFCSERCRTIDLGRWASGDYVISTPVTDPEALESQNRNLQRGVESGPHPNGHTSNDDDRGH